MLYQCLPSSKSNYVHPFNNHVANLSWRVTNRWRSRQLRARSELDWIRPSSREQKPSFVTSFWRQHVLLYFGRTFTILSRTRSEALLRFNHPMIKQFWDGYFSIMVADWNHEQILNSKYLFRCYFYQHWKRIGNH